MLFSDLPGFVAKNFHFTRVDVDHDLMSEIYRLRYQVYCIERGFECPDDYPDGLEMDAYDLCSNHFCAISVANGKVIGTVRIIRDSCLGLPIERHCHLNKHRFTGTSTEVGEISRLAVSKDFRCLEINRLLGELQHIDFRTFKQVQEIKRALEDYIVIGLYQCLYHHSIELGLTHWYAVMSEALHGLLRRKGIAWTQIGAVTEYHGRRIPYLADIAENRRKISLLNPQLLCQPTGWS
ncbi:PEP-CTERM/exosortase system-associated acyltransferase [uncultured Desulfuromonas sp.]|uniref:PEP-CTERM/exosortase system-associated acyltransferase n=1 Tax=uncultured Desulfuromonas sp. TaxID=181013 RepID=UPI002AAB7EFE|nr:PEP-CTERM/exosortase system-associated acyltransferase [uncultured Desulfuromonas sp.]